MHEVLVNRLGGLSQPRKSVVRLTDRPDMTLDVYRGRKTTIQQQQCTCIQNIGPVLIMKYVREIYLVRHIQNGFRARCMQLFIRSAEPPGEHRHKNRNNNNNIRHIHSDTFL